MTVVEVNEQNFSKEVEGSEKPVIVDFWAPWCGPCQMLKPIFHELSDKMSELKFCSVNVDENKDLALTNAVRGIPCLIIFNQGSELDRIVGFSSIDELKKLVKNIVSRT